MGIELNTSLINLHVKGDDFSTVLSYGVDVLIDNGFAQEEYRYQVIKREKECPTALQFEYITVALAHGDPIGVNDSAMVIERCEDRPLFGLMDNPDEMVPVEMVILLAVNDPNSHIKILARLIDALSKKDVCEILKHSDSIDEVCAILKNELLKENYEDE